MENTIKLDVDALYILDLQDDFKMNTSKDLYQFIGGDPVKAFHLGMNVKEWFETIEPKQQYLYSKQLRHNKDLLGKYLGQMKFWTNKFTNDEEADLLDLSEYILNNMFWEEETEELDRVKMAIFLGQSSKFQADKQNGEAFE